MAHRRVVRRYRRCRSSERPRTTKRKILCDPGQFEYDRDIMRTRAFPSSHSLPGPRVSAAAYFDHGSSKRRRERPSIRLSQRDYRHGGVRRKLLSDDGTTKTYMNAEKGRLRRYPTISAKPFKRNNNWGVAESHVSSGENESQCAEDEENFGKSMESALCKHADPRANSVNRSPVIFLRYHGSVCIPVIFSWAFCSYQQFAR